MFQNDCISVCQNQHIVFKCHEDGSEVCKFHRNHRGCSQNFHNSRSSLISPRMLRRVMLISQIPNFHKNWQKISGIRKQTLRIHSWKSITKVPLFWKWKYLLDPSLLDLMVGLVVMAELDSAARAAKYLGVVYEERWRQDTESPLSKWPSFRVRS